MKSIFTLILTLTVAYQLGAKGTSEAMITIGPTVGGQFPHFGDQVGGNNGGANQPVKVSLRLIGKTFTTFSNNAFIPVDSITYSYSMDRGGVLKNNNVNNDEPLMYDESNKYIFNAGSYAPMQRRVQTYNTKNEVLSLTYASWKVVKAEWKDSARYLYSYANNRMTSSVLEQRYADMWTNAIASDIKYAGTNVESMESPVYKIVFTYDGNNNLTTMIDQQNVLGNWQFKEKHTYAYNSNNEVTAHTIEIWNAANNTWVNDKKWEYTYSGTDVASDIESHWNGISWNYHARHNYAYDSKHNQLNDVLQLWNGSSFVNISVEIWEYNSQDLPTRITTNSWNGSMWVNSNNDKQYRFYYENYFPSHVPGFTDKSPVHVYPVPATDILNVDLAFSKPEAFTVAIYDMKGAVLQQWNEAGTTAYRKTFPVSDLPAGNYFLRVAGRETNITERFTVSR
jgi:hypothetical protein